MLKNEGDFKSEPYSFSEDVFSLDLLLSMLDALPFGTGSLEALE